MFNNKINRIVGRLDASGTFENPNKYINSLNNEKYIFTSTIQKDRDNMFIWEPIITSSDNDYVWIPITSELFTLKGDN